MGRATLLNLKDAANAGREEKQEKTEARQGVAESSGKLYNFLFSAGNTRSRGLFMVPVRWKEGKKREGGRAALGLRLKPWGREKRQELPSSAGESTHAAVSL